MKQATIRFCVVSTLYIVICLLLTPISFGSLQLRLGELLCLLAIEKPIHIFSISFGCLISNLLLSPFGIIDAIIGSLASLIGCSLGYLLRKYKYKNFPIISAVTISLINAIMVSLEMTYVLGNEVVLIVSFIEIFISEIIILVIIGYPIYNRLIKIDKGE